MKFMEEANKEFIRGLSADEEKALRGTLKKIRQRTG
jgi:hypothetical protein